MHSKQQVVKMFQGPYNDNYDDRVSKTGVLILPELEGFTRSDEGFDGPEMKGTHHNEDNGHHMEILGGMAYEGRVKRSPYVPPQPHVYVPGPAPHVVPVKHPYEQHPPPPAYIHMQPHVPATYVKPVMPVMPIMHPQSHYVH